MQYIPNRIKASGLKIKNFTKLSHLKRFKTPFKRKRGKYERLFTPSTTLSSHITSQVNTTNLYRAKKIAQISGLALLSLPAKSLMLSESQEQRDQAYYQVMINNTLTVASVAGDSTFFATDGFQHGFGYDLTRAYASHLDVRLELKSYADEEAALNAVNNGDADMALTTSSLSQTEQHELSTLYLSCGRDDKLTQSGLNPRTNWSFKSSSDQLAVKASHYLCSEEQLNDTAKLANFYDQNLLKDTYTSKHFESALNDKLPNYKSTFQEQAENYDHDWQLLVAMGYQESHLDANAISPTGVQGIMMLTNSTARAMGVSNRVDPNQSISGGARYLEQMKETFSDVPNPDRLWFALASYNMGPNAIKRIQSELEEQGEDPNSWSNVYAYLSDNAAQNSRYVQCMHYVKNIRSYLESIKTQTVNV